MIVKIEVFGDWMWVGVGMEGLKQDGGVLWWLGALVGLEGFCGD